LSEESRKSEFDFDWATYQKIAQRKIDRRNSERPARMKRSQFRKYVYQCGGTLLDGVVQQHGKCKEDKATSGSDAYALELRKDMSDSFANPRGRTSSIATPRIAKTCQYHKLLRTIH
jgi:hypothetical protein